MPLEMPLENRTEEMDWKDLLLFPVVNLSSGELNKDIAWVPPSASLHEENACGLLSVHEHGFHY